MDPDDKEMTFERAGAIGDIAQVIVNTAKVEVQFIKQTGHGGSGFIQGLPPAPASVQPHQLKPVGRSKSLGGLPPHAHSDLCLKCTLPECRESSPMCLIQIEKKRAAA